jgi:hypothetical protein
MKIPVVINGPSINGTIVAGAQNADFLWFASHCSSILP